MKKILIIIFLLIIILLLSNKEVKEEKNETIGVFISYIELNKYTSNDINTSKNNIDKMISNIKKTSINTIILQVRSKQDSIYKSNIFPNKNFDILDYFIEKSHKNNIKLIAWINPYRVDTTNDINKISTNSPISKWIKTDYIYISNGIYLNPNKQEVEDLIVEGVKEVLNYNVDGVLFDDYFYQNDLNNTKEHNLSTINHMVERVHKECQKKNILFGISPDGNIDNNYNKNYADVKTWLSSNKYIDFIMPQIYYGFYNSTKDYVNVVKEWESLLKTKKVKLLIALAFYKVGLEDHYAKEGRDEWKNNNDIIMREVILSRNLKNYTGFALFRYDSLFDEENYTNTSKDELENLKNIIN